MLTIMKTRSGLAALALAALMLAGCSSAVESEPAAEAEPTVEAPAEERTSTVAQWASLIAQQQAGWEDWEDKWDDAQCSSIEATLESGLICRIQLLSASAKSQTTSIEYELATTPGKKGFIAEEPPEEVSSLFNSTAGAANAAQSAGEAWTDAGCDNSLTDGCGGLAFNFQSAVEDLLSEFDAWAPYN